MKIRVLLSMFLLLAVATPVHADVVVQADPDDALGELDIREAWHGHTTVQGSRALVHGMRTFEPWSNDILLEDRGKILWQFELKDAEGNFMKGRNVYTSVKAGEVVAVVETIPNCDCSTKTIGVLPVKRPDDHAIRVVIPKKYLGRAATYKWFVYTEFQFPDKNAEDCPKSDSVWESACMDDIGPFKHTL